MEIELNGLNFDTFCRILLVKPFQNKLSYYIESTDFSE